MAKKPVAQSTKIGTHLCQKLHKNIHASLESVPSHAKVGKIQIQFNRSSISVAGSTEDILSKYGKFRILFLKGLVIQNVLKDFSANLAYWAALPWSSDWVLTEEISLAQPTFPA